MNHGYNASEREELSGAESMTLMEDERLTEDERRWIAELE
jgi:hypothetical protein